VTTRVLFVCTANIVRSPTAAALLQMRLQEETEVVVESAGLREPDHRADEGAMLALKGHGIDLRLHRSRLIDAAMVGRATLVLGLERAHVREAVVLDQSAWPRTFTLKEIIRRGEATGGRRRGDSIEDWVARMSPGRAYVDLLGADPIDDVADPHGGPPGEYEDAVEEIDDLVVRLVRLAWPERAPPGPP
jgi:low molecular weight protein-tyrosine phosphatase